MYPSGTAFTMTATGIAVVAATAAVFVETAMISEGVDAETGTATALGLRE